MWILPDFYQNKLLSVKNNTSSDFKVKNNYICNCIGPQVITEYFITIILRVTPEGVENLQQLLFKFIRRPFHYLATVRMLNSHYYSFITTKKMYMHSIKKFKHKTFVQNTVLVRLSTSTSEHVLLLNMSLFLPVPNDTSSRLVLYNSYIFSGDS